MHSRLEVCQHPKAVLTLSPALMIAIIRFYVINVAENQKGCSGVLLQVKGQVKRSLTKIASEILPEPLVQSHCEPKEEPCIWLFPEITKMALR